MTIRFHTGDLPDTARYGASVAIENANLSHQLRRSEAVLERANRLSSVGMLAAGMRNAQDPIMMGNAAFGFIQRRPIMMRQGA